MECVENSRFSLSESCITTSQLSQGSQLLESRLSNHQMQEMSMESLLFKLLNLYQTLQNTDKDNQLLRIQKAQLSSQLKSCKTRAESIIRDNSEQKRCHSTNGTESVPEINCIHNTPVQSIQNVLTTPYEFEDSMEYKQKNNKVFVKSHKRRISNNSIQSRKEINVETSKNYKSSLNSPIKRQLIKLAYSQKEKINNFTKNSIPWHKLNDMIVMERQYDEKEELQNQSQTLENFQSFYHHNRQSQLQTTRRQAFQNSLPKSCWPESCYHKRSYNNQGSVFVKKDNKFNNSPHFDGNIVHESYYGQKGLEKSMSSSNLSNQNESSKGFKIPSSIEQIWGSTIPSVNFIQKAGSGVSKLSKLTKTNITKCGQNQKKSYLHS